MVEEHLTVRLEEMGGVRSVKEDGEGHAVPDLGEFVVFMGSPAVNDYDCQTDAILLSCLVWSYSLLAEVSTYPFP